MGETFHYFLTTVEKALYTRTAIKLFAQVVVARDTHIHVNLKMKPKRVEIEFESR